MTLCINGIGIVSAVGCGINEFRNAVEKNIVPEAYCEDIETPEGIKKQVLLKAEAKGLDAFIDKRQLRRVDRFSQMALLASYQAVADAGIELKNTERAGLIFGTAYGASSATFNFLDSVIKDGDKCASPTFFALSVHNSLAAQVSVNMEILGPVQSFSNFGDTVFNVLRQAEIWLESSRVNYVLVGFGDEHCAVRTYASAIYDCECIPGEGFTVFLLSKKEKTKYGTLDLERTKTFEGATVSMENIFGCFPTNGAMNIAAAAVMDGKEFIVAEKSIKEKNNIYKIRK